MPRGAEWGCAPVGSSRLALHLAQELGGVDAVEARDLHEVGGAGLGRPALYVAYATAARFFSVDSFQILLPQALFMLAATIVISLFVSARESTDGVFGRVEGVFGIKSWQNMLTGVLWSVANIAVLFSNQVNGVAVGWTLANMNLIFATLGGLFILHEKKTPKELRFVIAGMVLIALGGIAIGVTKLG